MNELEELKRARDYIGMLARGRDPITGADINEDSVFNNIRVCRCLFYVEEVLGQLVNNATVSKPKKKEPFHITPEALSRYEFPPEPLPVTKIAQRINALTTDECMKKLSHKWITDFLINVGVLQIIDKPDGKHAKRPTPFGESMGVTLDYRHGLNGPYFVIVYNREAQQFILDNMDSILADKK